LGVNLARIVGDAAAAARPAKANASVTAAHQCHLVESAGRAHHQPEAVAGARHYPIKEGSACEPAPSSHHPLVGYLVVEADLVLGHQTLFASDILSRLPRLLLENSLHDARANTELPADFEDAITGGPQLQDTRFHRWLDSPAAQLRAIRPGACEPSIYPFSNDPPLELSEYAEHLKHRFARGRRSIKSLLVKE